MQQAAGRVIRVVLVATWARSLPLPVARAAGRVIRVVLVAPWARSLHYVPLPVASASATSVELSGFLVFSGQAFHQRRGE